MSKIDQLKADAAKFSEPAAYQTADPALYKSVRVRACVRALAVPHARTGNFPLL